MRLSIKSANQQTVEPANQLRRPPRRTATLRLITAIVVLLIAFAAVVGACGGDDDASGGDDKINVVTTLPLFAEFVSNIGGGDVDVRSLLPLGADPHTFEASPRDVETVTEAEIVFANGFDLEPSLIEIIEPNLPSSTELVLLGEEARNAGAATLEGSEEGEPINPHLWMDPKNARLYVATIRDSLSDMDPEGAADYTDAYDRYAQEIDEAGSYVSNSVDTIPENVRKLVTTHDAFGYFADAFGLEVTEFVAESPSGDPSPEDIAEIAAVLEAQEVPAVFAEPQVHEEGEILEQAAADAGVEVCVLYSDSLDAEVTSYIDLMRFNADELARCLG